MGSVISGSECPHCGNPSMYDEFYYKTGEAFQSCFLCGYHYSNFLERDEEGTYKKDENGEYLYKEEIIDEPIGHFFYGEPNGSGQAGTISSPEELQMIYDGIEEHLKTYPELIVRLNFFENGKFREVTYDIDHLNGIEIWRSLSDTSISVP